MWPDYMKARNGVGLFQDSPNQRSHTLDAKTQNEHSIDALYSIDVHPEALTCIAIK